MHTDSLYRAVGMFPWIKGVIDMEARAVGLNDRAIVCPLIGSA
jgi:hypothetical protein